MTEWPMKIKVRVRIFRNDNAQDCGISQAVEDTVVKYDPDEAVLVDRMFRKSCSFKSRKHT